jgi:anaerobic ribonucleoside-triphosphate reductase activating protein
MGGDANPDYLDYLAQQIKEQTRLKIAVYSGLTNPPLFSSLFFDYIKVGPYIPSRGPLNSKHTNQRLFKGCGNKWIDITYRMFT